MVGKDSVPDLFRPARCTVQDRAGNGKWPGTGESRRAVSLRTCVGARRRRFERSWGYEFRRNGPYRRFEARRAARKGNDTSDIPCTTPAAASDKSIILAPPEAPAMFSPDLAAGGTTALLLFLYFRLIDRLHKRARRPRP